MIFHFLSYKMKHISKSLGVNLGAGFREFLLLSLRVVQIPMPAFEMLPLMLKMQVSVSAST